MTFAELEGTVDPNFRSVAEVTLGKRIVAQSIPVVVVTVESLNVWVVVQVAVFTAFFNLLSWRPGTANTH